MGPAADAGEVAGCVSGVEVVGDAGDELLDPAGGRLFGGGRAEGRAEVFGDGVALVVAGVGVAEEGPGDGGEVGGFGFLEDPQSGGDERVAPGGERSGHAVVGEVEGEAEATGTSAPRRRSALSSRPVTRRTTAWC